MKDKQARRVEVALRPEDKDMPLCPGSTPRTSIRAMSRAACTSAQARRQARMAAHAGLLAREERVPAIDLDDKAFVYK
jgi:hypothetical protein